MEWFSKLKKKVGTSGKFAGISEEGLKKVIRRDTGQADPYTRPEGHKTGIIPGAKSEKDSTQDMVKSAQEAQVEYNKILAEKKRKSKF